MPIRLNPPEWQARMFEERKQLSERIKLLEEFVHHPDYNSLFEEDRRLLTLQLHHMREYGMILSERILRLPRGTT